MKFVMLCSNNVSEELVSSSLRASPLMNLLFTPVDGRLKNGCTEVFQGAQSGCAHLAPTQF